MAMVNTKIPDAAAIVKKTLGPVTWEEVIKEGLKAIKKRKLEEKSRSKEKTSAHVETEAERSPEPQTPGDEAYETPGDKRQHLSTEIIELPIKMGEREYHIYNRILRMWKKVRFDDISEGTIFRIMEKGRVVKVGGHKYLSYVGFAYRSIQGDYVGELCAKVIGRQMTF